MLLTSRRMEVIHKPIEIIGIRHVQVFLLFMLHVIAFASRNGVSVAIIAMTDTKSNHTSSTIFDWDSHQKSLVLSSTIWGSVAAQICSGFIAKLIGNKNILLCGILISSTLNILTPPLAMYSGWVAVICCRIGIGICQSCFIPSIKGLLSNWAPIEERSKLASFVLNGAQFGNIISFSLSGYIAAKLGWPFIFYIFGIIGVALAILFYWFGSESPANNKYINSKEQNYIINSLEKFNNNIDKQQLQFPWKEVLKSSPVWCLIISNCCSMWGFILLITQMPTYMKYMLNVDIMQSGILSSLPYLSSWLFVFPISWLSDFALQKGASVTKIRKICNTIGMWGPGLMLFILCSIETQNKVMVVFIFVIMLILNSAIICGSDMNEMDLSPNHTNMLSAIVNTFSKSFSLFAPIVCGWAVKDVSNLSQWHTVLYTTASIYIFGNLVFLLFGKAEVQYWNSLYSKQRSSNCLIPDISK